MAQAVDSEYNKNLQLDSRRLYQLMRHCSSPGQPFHQFGTGNINTLKTLPEVRRPICGLRRARLHVAQVFVVSTWG